MSAVCPDRFCVGGSDSTKQNTKLNVVMTASYSLLFKTVNPDHIFDWLSEVPFLSNPLSCM